VGGGTDSTLPTVSYTEDQEVSSDMKNFMNADWLYEQYFGEYGLPDEFKPMVIDEVKRIANGFALSFAQNRDVDTEIAEFQSTMKLLQMSGQFNQMVTSLEQELYNRTYDINTSSRVAAEHNKSVLTDVVNENTQSEWDEHVANHPEILEDHQGKYEAEQIAMVKQYNLPYPLEGKYPKYIHLGNNMKNWFGKPIKPTKPKPQHTSKISTWHFEPGMFLYKSAGVGHVAMILKYQNCRVGRSYYAGYMLVEALPETGVWGLTNAELESWQNRYNKVMSYAYRDSNNFDGGASSIPHSVRMEIAQCAENQIGKSYNWNFFDARDPESTYCSQLIWGCYNQRIGYWWKNRYREFKADLDYNGGPIVFPRDLAAHYQTRIVNISTKR